MILDTAKAWAAKILESHPYGYALGVMMVRNFDFVLPHEHDYYGFRHLATTEDGLFLDLGANVGHSARGFHKLVPRWKILSIEPNLMHETSLKSFKARFEGYDYRIAAVDRTSGDSLTLFVPVYRGMYLHSAAAVTLEDAKLGISGSFPRQAHQINYVEFRTQTVAIDDLHLQPQIIKLDIQGKELAALKGGELTIKRCRPLLLIELVTNADAIAQYMATLGYRPFAYRSAEDDFHELNGVENLITRNVFFFPQERISELSRR